MSFFKNTWNKNPALHYKEFRWYMLIRFAGIYGLMMQITTIFYWVYQVTGSELKLGLVGLAEVIPAVSISLISGYLVDKGEKRKNLLLCFISYFILAVLLYYFTQSDTLHRLGNENTLWIIYGLVFCGGILRSFLGPSAFALMGYLLPKKHYPNAASWSSLSWQLGATLGPLTGGLIIGFWDVSTSMLCVAFIMVIPVLSLLPISKKPVEKKKTTGAKEPILDSIKEGLRFVYKTPIILGALVLDLFSVLFGGAIALLPVFQKEILKVDEMGYGILRAAPGIGAIICLIIITILPLQKNSGYKLFISVACFGVCIIVFGLSTHFYLSFAMLVLSGVFDAVSVVIRSTILQLYTPTKMRGRVAAVNTMFISSSNELGDFESGVMAHWIGPVRAVVVGGVLTLGVVALTFSRAPQLRRFEIAKENEDLIPDG